MAEPVGVRAGCVRACVRVRARSTTAKTDYAISGILLNQGSGARRVRVCVRAHESCHPTVRQDRRRSGDSAWLTQVSGWPNCVRVRVRACAYACVRTRSSNHRGTRWMV
jgi:hypothetical protein